MKSLDYYRELPTDRLIQSLHDDTLDECRDSEGTFTLTLLFKTLGRLTAMLVIAIDQTKHLEPR